MLISSVRPTSSQGNGPVLCKPSCPRPGAHLDALALQSPWQSWQWPCHLPPCHDRWFPHSNPTPRGPMHTLMPLSWASASSSRARSASRVDLLSSRRFCNAAYLATAGRSWRSIFSFCSRRRFSSAVQTTQCKQKQMLVYRVHLDPPDSAQHQANHKYSMCTSTNMALPLAPARPQHHCQDRFPWLPTPHT